MSYFRTILKAAISYKITDGEKMKSKRDKLRDEANACYAKIYLIKAEKTDNEVQKKYYISLSQHYAAKQL